MPRLVLFQICLAWAVVSVSIRAATSQTDEVDPDSEVDVFLPALAKKLAKRSTTRKFRLVTTGRSSVADEVSTDGPDPNKAGKLAVINIGGGQRRRQQQQRRRNRNNNNNFNANNFNNNNILNSNPMMINGTSYGVANPNPIQRRTNQRRRQQQVKFLIFKKIPKKFNYKFAKTNFGRLEKSFRIGERDEEFLKMK